MPTDADKAKETWRGWSSQSSGWIPLDQLLADLQESYGIEVDQAQVKQWADRGFLPPFERPYGSSDIFLIRAVHRAEQQGLYDSEIRSLARNVADTLNEDSAIETRTKLDDLATEAKQQDQTWLDWIPDQWPAPADDELISRDELLNRVQLDFGLDIHPDTLRAMERQGRLPRPIRKWHEGATRALYAPWVVDLVGRAYYRRGGDDLEAAIADVRSAVPQAILLYGDRFWEGKTVPMAFMDTLTEFAEVQERRLGIPLPFAEIRFLDESGKPIVTMRQSITRKEGLASQ